MTNFNNLTAEHDRVQDLLFLVRYIPKILAKGLAYGLCGLTGFYAWTSIYNEGINHYVKENYKLITATDYIDDENEFMHMSRDARFNKQTPPDSQMVPLIAGGFGGSMCFFLGVCNATKEFKQELNTDRKHREPKTSFNV